MKISKIALVSFIVLVLLTGYLALKLFAGNLITNDSKQIPHDRNTRVKKVTGKAGKDSAVSDCEPTFSGGGGPNYTPDSPFRETIVPDNNEGEELVISGKILLSDCKTAVKNAVLDIWQADENGEYQDEWYRGKVRTDQSGGYQFETVVPTGYGEGTGFRPPHIHFKVFKDNKELITSQMFIPNEHNPADFSDYTIDIKQASESGEIVLNGTHNIILPHSSLEEL